jgi:octaprenyl-diphosphate synthase
MADAAPGTDGGAGVSGSGGSADPTATAAADLRAVEACLETVGASRSLRLGEASRHLLRAGGKRLRALLGCAVMRALGADPRLRLELLAAVELVHTGSLLHDDLLDGSAVRRGRPAVHVAYDPHTAVLAGDMLLSWAFERLARDGTREIQIALGVAVRELCEGEVLERERRFDPAADLAHARTVNRLKTASLFAYAAETGARLAEAPEALRAACREYGTALGEAFQTADDLLDWQGDAAALGKPVGQDLRQGLVTVPAALGLERDPALRPALAALWQAGPEAQEEPLEILRRGFDRVGAFEAARALAAADVARAVAAAERLPEGPWRGALAQAARAAVGRSR